MILLVMTNLILVMLTVIWMVNHQDGNNINTRLDLFEENIQYLKKVLIAHNDQEESFEETIQKTQMILESSNLSK